MPDERVLVVGTTPDYIDAICRRFPERALFLTDPKERAQPTEYLPPEQATELLCELTHHRKALAALKNHLRRWRISLRGVACFDCESLALAAYLAGAFSLPFASPEAVAASRNKFVSKQRWRKAGLPCPRVELVRDISDAVRFHREAGRAVVLKPLTGSGSELVFLCHDEEDCRHAFRALGERLAGHPDRRMYGSDALAGAGIDPRRVFVIEEFVPGDEYSCDFALDGEKLSIIRTTKKIPARGHTFGTVLAYIIPAELPRDLDPAGFRDQLKLAARALDIQRSICMLDFIVADGRALMIEMTPRPGGDCLPELERLSSGFDMLGYALDFAGRRPVDPPELSRWRRLVGLHLLAGRPGVIRLIDARNLQSDPRVLECRPSAGPGYRVLLPPDDYDSRKLGHVIFRPSSSNEIEKECLDLAARLTVEMEGD